jgi:hypothetical protein
MDKAQIPFHNMLHLFRRHAYTIETNFFIFSIYSNHIINTLCSNYTVCVY